MTAKPKPFCVYCQIERATDKEHVFPASWYPDNTPAAIQRLTVPSCRECNQRWQKVEETVGHDLLMICDADHPDAAGVLDRITKGWDASQAKNARDAKHREGRARRILGSIRWEKAHPAGPQVPFKLPDGRTVHLSPARELDPKALNALAEKFVRGLHYAENKGDVPLANLVSAMLVPIGGLNMVTQGPPPVYPPSLVQTINSLPINDRLRPGFLYRWTRHKTISVWCFLLWGHVTILAVCEPRRVIPAR